MHTITLVLSPPRAGAGTQGTLGRCWGWGQGLLPEAGSGAWDSWRSWAGGWEVEGCRAWPVPTYPAKQSRV